MRTDDQLDIVLTSAERPADTLIVSGPLHLWARLLTALGAGQSEGSPAVDQGSLPAETRADSA